jgi:hypothetical protein
MTKARVLPIARLKDTISTMPDAQIRSVVREEKHILPNKYRRNEVMILRSYVVVKE